MHPHIPVYAPRPHLRDAADAPHHAVLASWLAHLARTATAAGPPTAARVACEASARAAERAPLGRPVTPAP